MATILDGGETSCVRIGSGESQVTINVKPLKTEEGQILVYPSISIECNGLEIEIRRTGPARSRSVSNRINDYEKRIRSASQSHWDYSNSYGPNMWSRIFPQLQCKKFQSPVRIYTNQCEYDPMLARYPFIFDADENCCQTLENTGHSFQVSGRGYSYITGGPMLDEYQFLQFHMHWGANDKEGSEHVIDGVRFPAELHIVTWNTSQYKTPQDAVTSERFGGLMVFAILIKITSNDNPEMGKLLDLFSKIIYKGDKINLDSNIVSLRSLMPESMQDFYTYDGSLTTPMCQESVRWIVFRDQMGLSQNQLNQLRQLKHICKTEPSTDGCIQRNYRPLMPLNGRIINRSFA